MTIHEALGVEPGDHPTFEMLEQVVDGTADDVTLEIVESHCEVCRTCDDELRDLRTFAGHPSSSASTRMLGVAAAIVVVIAAGWFLMRARPVAPVVPRHPERIAQSGYGRADWDEAVRDALARGAIDRPHDDWPAADPQRGASDAHATADMSPVRMVIDTTTPLLQWRTKPGRYEVSVYDDAKLVAQSGELLVPQWQVTPPLARGRTYAWQVNVQRGASFEQLPVPPAPWSMFHILDEQSSASLAEARRKFPNDHLLLGVLEARFGMTEAAAQDLRLYAAQHPDDVKASALVQNVE